MRLAPPDRRAWRWLAGLGAVAWLGSGTYSVGSDESAVAFALGRAVGRDLTPGIQWNVPRPFGRVVVAKTATSFTMPVGYRLLEQPELEPISDLWLTGDTNIVVAQLNLQYRLRSLYAFLVDHEEPRELLRRVGERVVTAFLVNQGVDAALTTRRQDLPIAVQRGVQALLDAEQVGIDLQSVTIVDLGPPGRGGVRNAFQQVQDATADRERTIHEARAYRAALNAAAQGEADRTRSVASADRHRRIEMARGEADRFLAIARAHAAAPRLTEDRLYLETLDRLLPSIQTYIVDPAPDGRVNLRVVQ